jgi:hypothetical protein
LNAVDNLTTDRHNYARSLLTKSSARKKYQLLSDSDAVMDILCEKDSSIRDDGDEVAHSNLNADELQDLLQFLPYLLNPHTKVRLDMVIKHLISSARNTGSRK